MTTRELVEQRAQLVADQRKLVAQADAAGRDMTAEENAKWNEMDAEADRLFESIKKRKKLEAAERSLETPGTEIPAPDPTYAHVRLSHEERSKKEMAAFSAWVRFGENGLNPEQRMIMAQKRTFLNMNGAEVPAEIRAQSTTTTAGGYLVPQGFSEELQKYLLAFGGVREVARAFPTPAGNDIPWPTVDDTTNVGELLSENSAANAQDVAFGQVILKAFKFSSKIVLVSMELLQDSFFDVNSILRDLLGERIGRITNTYFTTGAGSTAAPQGVVTGAQSGKASTSTTALTYEDLVDLVHSVNPLYRPGSSWMMNDGSVKYIKKLKDSSGRPLWQPYGISGIGTEVAQDQLLGYPYVINQDMADIGRAGSPLVGSKSILFGNFNRYIVRDVMEMTLLRLTERYAEYGQVGFLAFARSDGRYINTKAVSYFKNADS